MKGLYILKGGAPVPEPDTVKWAQWFEASREARVVAKTVIGAVTVSTVFLGLDHGYGNGPPVLWESMVFGGPRDGDERRYTSRAHAEAGHAEMVRIEEGK